MNKRYLFFALTVATLTTLALGLTLPAHTARAQNPTPAPTPTLYWYEDCAVNSSACGERVAREFGFLPFVLGALALVVVVFIARAFWKGASKPVAEKIENQGARLVTRDDALTEYLKKAEGDYRQFKFRGLDARAKNIFTPELDKAFVSLRLAPEADPETRLRPEKGAEELTRALEREHIQPITLAHALEHAPRLAIVGAAGSGKSTLLQWAGLAMTRARLDERAASEEQRAFVKNAGAKLTPILLPLRAFADDCAAQKTKPNAAALLAFFTKYVKEKHPTLELPDAFFEKQLRGNGMLVMFDGVDEVAPQDRAAVRAAMEDLAREFARNEKNRYLVTSRTYAYFGGAQVANFRRCEVQNLDETQRDTLITSWCRAAYDGDAGLTNARDLIHRLGVADERVRALAVTPLMTTIFALVHYDRKELPKQRAELYEHAVRILLTEPYHDDAPRLDWEERRNRLAAIAFEMHAENVEELPEDDLVELCWHAFGAEEKSARKAAQDFFRAVADRGGLLEEVNGKYGFFTHRTFREFLAGRFLAEEKSASEQSAFLRRRLDNDQWVEATRLAAGYLAIAGERRANDFIARLADLGDTDAARAQALTLAGLALSDLPPARIASETYVKVSRGLLGQLETNPPRVEPRLRRGAGLALGAVGDPRFARSPIVVGPGAGWRFPALVTIPAGEFLMGTSDVEADALKQQKAETWDDEKPQHRVSVSEFAIGKYPITNEEFRAFWHADGYEDESLWSADGWKWRKGQLDADLSVYSKDYRKTVKQWLDGRPVEKRGEPFFWRDPQWNASNLPVVGVTWFEAEAYCNWLTRMSEGVKGRGSKGEIARVTYRLPTEAEWERAARGPQNFLWSWGNTWDANKCNSGESKFEATTSAGMYPDGTWRDADGNFAGPLDMSGNVWEWCGDWWQSDLYATRAHELTNDPRGPASGSARVLRGGSWFVVRWDVRAAYRNGDEPMDFNNYVGFRVVRVPIRS